MTREEAKEILTHNWTRVDNPNYSESELDEAFFMAIDALSADAVEVVRCGYCKHMRADGHCYMFADDNIRPSVSDFCSYGKRKGGEEE